MKLKLIKKGKKLSKKEENKEKSKNATVIKEQRQKRTFDKKELLR
jgi:hypothetical protein